MTDNAMTDRGPVAVGVSFEQGGKVYYFSPNGVRVRRGDKVLARTERGVDLGEVVFIKEAMDGDDADRSLKPLLRWATRDDIAREKVLREREAQAQRLCAEKVEEHGLPMKLIGADFTFDAKRLVFFFTSEGRVDFRALVRDLAETFRCRIELRQVGVRDEAKMLGGLGPCGRPLCCAQWLRNFEPVGIKIAKDQGMSLNPAKISGICDRLMCCLLYEHQVYVDAKHRMPRIGDEVRGQGRAGRVKGVAVLREQVTIDFQTNEGIETQEVAVADLRSGKEYWLFIGATEAKPAEPSVAVEQAGTSARAERAEAGPKVEMRDPRRGRTTQDRPERKPRSRRDRRDRDKEDKPAAAENAATPAPPSEATTGEEQKPARRRPRRRRKRKPDREKQGAEANAGQGQAQKPADKPSEGRSEGAAQKAQGSGDTSGKPAGEQQKAEGQGGTRRRRPRRRRPRRSSKPEGNQGGAGPSGGGSGDGGKQGD